MKSVLVKLTENARTPGAHVGREFCKPFWVEIYVPKRALI